MTKREPFPDQTRNLNPHAEARAAMWLWSDEYAGNRDGSMDFWDSRTPYQKRLCKELVDQVLDAIEKNGRAEVSP